MNSMKSAMMLAFVAAANTPFEEQYSTKRRSTAVTSTKEERNISKGLKLFNIDGHEIWAINETVAKKKFDKLLKNL